MTKIFARMLLLLSVSLTARADDATLLWHNGDSLSGKLLKADAGTLTWQSPMFTDPLQIGLSYLSSVKFPASEAAKADEHEFRILMRNGDYLNGRLKSITDMTMSFESTRLGAFDVVREQVLSLQRSDKSGMIYSGPRGLEQWQVTKKPPNVNNGAVFFGGIAGGGMAGRAAEMAPRAAVDKQIWSEAPDGSITTKKADTAIFLPLSLPDKYEIEFDVYSTKPLSFLMGIGQDSKNGLRIETWVDVLVAAQTTSFKALRTIGENNLSLHLYVFVNSTAQTMEVYSEAGEKLGEVSSTGLKADASGITFRNGDFDLAIRRLRVSHWDGKVPRIVSGDDSRIELVDGTTHFGKVQKFDSDAETLTLLVNQETISVPIGEVSSLVVSGESVGTRSERPSAWLNWNDGGYVSGSLISITNEKAELQASWSPSHLHCDLTGLATIALIENRNADLPIVADRSAERLLIAKAKLKELTETLDPDHAEVVKLKAEIAGTPDVSSAGPTDEIREPDRLFHEHGSLRGALVVEGAAETPIQWTPLGGLNASTLQGVENARFVRASGVQHLSESPELLAAFPDVVYLQNNDVLPCQIEKCTEDRIQFTSPLSEVRSFARDQIRAIELSAAGRIHRSGFADDGWQGFSSRREKEQRDKLVVRGNTRYSHPEILTGDTVRFHIAWPKQSSASLNISMFSSGLGDDEQCTQVCFSLLPDQIQVLDRPMPANQMMGMRMGGGPAGNINGGPVAVKDSEADIQLVARDGNIVVSVNESPAKTIKINAASSGRRGIAFNANLTTVGQVVVNGRVTQRADDGVTISRFEVDNLSGASIRQFIEEESRQAALTIPRFRRDSPPTHVLIAPNGDLLRGRLIEIDDERVTFESRLETLRFDRSRVGAVVWLDPPQVADSKTATADETDAAAVTENTTGDAASAPAKTLGSERDGFASDDEYDTSLQAQLADGFSITMKPVRLVDGRIEGWSALLGKCSFPAKSVRELFTGDPKASQRLAAYDTWVTRMAREPDWDIPQSDGGHSEASALIGKPAVDFELPLLDGTRFKLSDHKNKIIVLDFWATWCGPCVMALPDYLAATSMFDESKVIFVAVNLQESPEQIRTFLSDRQLSLHVALDRSSSVAPTFQVSGIPHTVIIGPDNIVEDVHVGYQPGSGEMMQITLEKMLDGTWKRNPQEIRAE